MNYIFLAENCWPTAGDISQDEAAALLNSLNISYSDGILTFAAPSGYCNLTISAVYVPDGSEDGVTVPLCVAAPEKLVDYDEADGIYYPVLAEGETYSVAYSQPDNSTLYVQAALNLGSYSEVAGVLVPDVTSGVSGLATASEDSGDDGVDDGTDDSGDDGSGETEDTATYIYPTGSIDIKALPVTPIGFAGMQSQTDITHVQIVVAEIQEDGTVGGTGHVWQSPFYPKDVDYKTTLANLVPLCEGQENTQFNVSYYLLCVNEADGYDIIRTVVVGDETTVPTFTVLDTAISTVAMDSTEYCLSPVWLKLNRRGSSDINRVRVTVADYSAVYEFMADRNILEIDLSEYLKVLFAGVDVFEYQALDQTIIVEMLDSTGNVLKLEGVELYVIYGKNPALELPEKELRVQWLDKYGYLHDEYFKIVENVTEGESAQKYVSGGEEREDKNGEMSITLAYVFANSAQREALKTLVFADHIRAYIGETWKRVKIENTYKTGSGREKQNFEFTIKYAL